MWISRAVHEFSSATHELAFDHVIFRDRVSHILQGMDEKQGYLSLETRFRGLVRFAELPICGSSR